ncbi:PEP-CTERM sorting domain-containing protein [Streptomyces sp. NPDC102360]|uniref:PEP-CTERM sorting domain-containing protein n=1 Tax=Streptomyces sp. NPDC102360 TaxID=3366160 RepID=UPI003826254D
MANQLKGADSGSGQGLLWLFGAILVVQGFGSAVTEAGWDTSFGVAALMRAAHVPEWATLLVGLAGLALLGMAARRRRAGRRAEQRP